LAVFCPGDLIVMEIVTGKLASPWVALIYGVPGVGKSTLAGHAPNPVFINLENGLDRVGVERTPHLKTFAEFFEAMKWAKNSQYDTVAIDTMSSLEDMLVSEILMEANAGKDKKYHATNLSDKEAFPYGAGFQVLKSKWAYVMVLIQKLQDAGKNVVCISHESVLRYQNPEGEDYDRYSPNIQKRSVDFVISQMDGVFFVQYDRLIRVKEGPMGKAIKYAQDTGKRTIQTIEKVTALAKNRFNLKPQLPFDTMDDAKDFWSHVK